MSAKEFILKIIIGVVVFLIVRALIELLNLFILKSRIPDFIAGALCGMVAMVIVDSLNIE